MLGTESKNSSKPLSRYVPTQWLKHAPSSRHEPYYPQCRTRLGNKDAGWNPDSFQCIIVIELSIQNGPGMFYIDRYWHCGHSGLCICLRIFFSNQNLFFEPKLLAGLSGHPLRAGPSYHIISYTIFYILYIIDYIKSYWIAIFIICFEQYRFCNFLQARPSSPGNWQLAHKTWAQEEQL